MMTSAFGLTHLYLLIRQGEVERIRKGPCLASHQERALFSLVG